MATTKIDVLDKGYVRLVNASGSDLDVVNAARASFNKESIELNDKDIRLIKYLAKNKESSPFRHSHITLEVYAPLMVARQWWKYAVGSSHLEDGTGWNETSRRYVTEDNEFYVPSVTEWRGAPDNMKQGSSGQLNGVQGIILTEALEKYVAEGERLYQGALNLGAAPEQARLFLPAYSLYVRWRWTASLSAVIHFLEERLAHGAQSEIRSYAEAVDVLAREAYPVSIESWIGPKVVTEVERGFEL
jgi:thymidylate synthase (FAD)